MHIETTLNVNVKNMEIISTEAEKAGISRSEFIVNLLKLVMVYDVKKAEVLSTVKYQQSTDNCSWHRFHITLKAEDYEFFLDLRKFMKLSVSRIVAFAVNKYIIQVSSKRITDNCSFSSYSINRIIDKNVIEWQIKWRKSTIY